MKKEDKIKLKVEDYVFEIDKEDIFETELKYNQSEMEVGYFENGKWCTKIVPLLEIELSGLNNEKKEAWISFNIKTDIKNLKSLPNNKIIDITNLISVNEAFVKRPNDELSEFLNFRLPEDNENDMYRLLTSLWVYKYNNNEFVFKLSIPDDVFTYFKVNFK